MNKPHPKEIQITSCFHRNHGYSPEGNYIQVMKIKDRRITFVSNVVAKSHGDNIVINILYSGKPSEVNPELLDKLLVTNDSSENPLRPFRWYRSKGNNDNFMPIVATTTDPQNVIDCRNQAFDSFLAYLDNPEEIWIYEIEEI